MALSSLTSSLGQMFRKPPLNGAPNRVVGNANAPIGMPPRKLVLSDGAPAVPTGSAVATGSLEGLVRLSVALQAPKVIASPRRTGARSRIARRANSKGGIIGTCFLSVTVK